MSRSFKANGNILPSRFVIQSTSADEKVTQSTAGAKVIGVSHEGARRPSYIDSNGYAAIAGDDLCVYMNDDECMLELGGTVSPGDYLKSDNDGKGVVTTTNLDIYGAIALQAGTSGRLVLVRVTHPIQVSAA